MSQEAERQLMDIQEEALNILNPFLADPAAKKAARIACISAWRKGFKLGRREGLIDQYMLGGEA